MTLTDTTPSMLDSGEYPTRWSDYVGQEPAKRMLQVAAKSARMRRTRLDHVLISHPSPGVGKSALAVLVAAELKAQVTVVSGSVTRDKARMLFADMEDNDVLLYDEVHQVMDGGRKNAEWLLSYLQDGVLMGPLGPEEQPRVTIIAATTDAGKLPESIVSRFPIKPPMQEYTIDEAAKIAQLMAERILIEMPRLNKANATALATAASSNPRAMKQLLTVLRDMTITEELALDKSGYDIAGLLEWQGVTEDGLDRTAQQYLRTLATEFDGSAGAGALEDRLAQPGGLGTVERMLMDKGLIAKTRSGRTLTQAGIRRFKRL